MTGRDYLLNLRDALAILDESLFWLKRSYDVCEKIGIKEEFTPEEFDAFETLTSRFARTGDMVLQKAFRSIDKVELTDGGTLLDVLNRAHKRGLIESVDEVRLIRELRNDIAHEYKTEKLESLFKEVLEVTPRLMQIIATVREYCQKYQSV